MRRSLCRLTLALLLACWLLADLPWSSRARAGESLDATRRRIRVPVLMYHYISAPPPNADRYRLDLSVTPAQFAAQLAWLRGNGYTTVTLGDLTDALVGGAPLPARPVILTFDDGYADAYTQAFPLLREAGMVGTFFVVTEWLDNRQAGYLTWDQAREMAAAGMAIESHSRSHPDLTDGCDYDCRVYQVLGSAETIAAEIGVRPRFFCYPGGRYDAAIFAVLEGAGMVGAVTTHGGTLHVSERPLELLRVRVRGTTTLREFGWMVGEWRK
ncbi:MAG: polysaccharide deacetylase family protein [Anaerolineae bacterium]|nr:polysaccharide deacetylase family protein [Anaerolineae bacterium]